ncbi:hypothetical protein [Photobacterium galatheae]|uniref:Uncharacterized protein n=1 Tax=Photobacterium galatheae TaxID=1654360 RepID=A0A066RQV4_9GAMM|nr:hypothetical protein [Photobacterium galatheae]KDM89763.1 hypothetical protein EA58_20115 [Photobacterium galatheae]MCM0151415.1 hypothetical protein [Photobacterium galatheae]
MEHIKKRYQQVQQQLNNDPNLEYWKDQQDKCREIYVKIVKSETAIMEWEVDYWGRYGKWGLPFFASFLFTFIPMFTVYWFARDHEDILMGLLAGFFVVPLPIIVLVLGAEWFPTRYYQKITASGFYSYGVKVGSERRKKMAKYCMMGGFVVAVILLFIAGPLIFAGAGAASLSFLSLGNIPEPDPEESAWPWLGVYSIVKEYKPFLYDKYKVRTHGKNYLILTKEQIYEVKNIISQYGQHELDVINRVEDSFFDRWFDHQETMPYKM